MHISSMPAMFFRHGRKLLAGLLAAAAFLLAAPTLATPAGQIVVYGARSGSTLTLSMRGDKLVVKGNMARHRPRGCRFTRGHLRAVCRTRGVSHLEIQMGPSGDFVRVAERLPFGLTVHLGAGSDKFIGNGERDVCYSEGSRRNRCVGGPNDDVCIMGPGQDGCHGEAGNDRLYGGRQPDQLYGGRGRDYCNGGPGWGKSHTCDAGPRR